MIFVDTAAWFALSVPADPDHTRVRDWFASNTRPLVTTDYVVDETLTLLRARGKNAAALTMGNVLLNGNLASIHKVNLMQILAAWELFQKCADKDWSFTDCVSYVVIQELGVATAVSLDKHFRQFGLVTVLP